MTDKIDLSIVVPCFNEQECLNEFHRRMTAACMAAEISSYEIVYVNDCSTDRTLEVLLDLYRADSSTKVIDLARNFGHQIALSAGLSDAQGELVLTIDADLQDPPELLSAMAQKIAGGADVVYATRDRRRGEGPLKRATAAIFYRVLSRISGTPIAMDTGDFRLMRRNVVDVLVRLSEAHRFVRGLVSWVGFVQVPIHYDRDPRYAGVTKYPFAKMLGLSLDAITGFASTPLRFLFLGSILGMGLAFVALGWTLYSLFFLNSVPGWASVMTVLLVFGSAQLFSIALIGEYVGRILIETKRRPLFVVRSKYPPSQNSTYPS